MQSHLGLFTCHGAVRLKCHLNLLLLGDRSEKMACHWAGHCHFSFCFFGAEYPQIQPQLVCVPQLPPELYPAYQHPRYQHWEPLGAVGCWITALEMQGCPPWQRDPFTPWWCPQPHDVSPLHVCPMSDGCSGVTISGNNPVTWRKALPSDPLRLMGSSWRMSLNICAFRPWSKRKDSPWVGQDLNRVLDWLRTDQQIDTE